MADYTLLRSQKNDILEIIRKYELDPYNFNWSIKPSRFKGEGGKLFNISIISYDNTEYYFIFDIQNGNHYSIFSPGGDKLHEHRFPGSWEGQLQYVIPFSLSTATNRSSDKAP